MKPARLQDLDVGNVPCNGCTACCRGDLIRLLPGDDASQYRTMPHPVIPGATALQRDGAGNCVYLTDTGCGIHGRAPRMCREMDCRIIAMEFTYTTVRKRRSWLRIWERGRQLLRETQ